MNQVMQQVLVDATKRDKASIKQLAKQVPAGAAWA